MSRQALTNWLKSQQSKLESILLKTAEEYYEHYSSNTNFPFDAKKTGEELWHLSSGHDLCYDRPTIGFNYSLWYHPKRINTFLQYFADLIYESRDEKIIQIFDLGAGTGAVMWTIGLITQGLKTLQLPCPTIRVINIDTSPFMLIYNRDYLWKNFAAEFELAREISNENDYRLNSWSNAQKEDFSNIWLCASYLFDHSENAESIAKDFQSLVESYKPNKVLLISALQKKGFIDTVSQTLTKLNYGVTGQTLDNQVFSGELRELTDFRNRLSLKHDLGLTGKTVWNIDSLYGRVLINKAPELLSNIHTLNLFIKPEKDRTKIQLTNEQQKAAEIGDRPTLVVGPAGCGKTVVLTQKVKNIVEANAYNPKLRILISSFNKELIRHLGDWIEQILDKGKFNRTFGQYASGNQASYSFFRFNNSSIPNIIVFHFDVLPTKLGNIRWYNVTQNGEAIENFHFKRMLSAVNKYVSINKTDRELYAKILSPEFLLEEYHRIVYGLECNTEKSFQSVERTGRGINPQLRFNSNRRRIVWGIIKCYLQDLRADKLESFVVRRHRLLKKLRASNFLNQFDYILIDEFQDCTKADYEIFYQLAKDPNHITFAGDLAQSIQLGTSLHFPLRAETENMRRFEAKRLNGSFRLPMRISECIKPFSENVSSKFRRKLGVGSDIITPYKGAPPGARPILIYASDANAAARKIAQVYFSYKDPLKLDKITIYEKDTDLSLKVNSLQIPCETEIILRTKGLEKNCVVWSTRTILDTNGECEEFIYTILTRTVSLLIVVVFPDMNREYLAIIQTFVSERLIQWDEETEKRYQDIRLLTQISQQADDEDTSEDFNGTDAGDLDISID